MQSIALFTIFLYLRLFTKYEIKTKKEPRTLARSKVGAGNFPAERS